MILDLVTLGRHSYSILSLQHSAGRLCDLVDLIFLEKPAFYLFAEGLAELSDLSAQPMPKLRSDNAAPYSQGICQLPSSLHGRR